MGCLGFGEELKGCCFQGFGLLDFPQRLLEKPSALNPKFEG